MPDRQVVETSPGPIYEPKKFCDKQRPPEWPLGPRTPYHLGRMKEHAYLVSDFEFVYGGAVIPGAPPPPGTPYSLFPGVPYVVGAINEVGRGSNKARTAALNRFLGVDEAAVARACVTEAPKPKEPYRVSEVCEIGRGSHVSRVATIEAFLTRAAANR